MTTIRVTPIHGDPVELPEDQIDPEQFTEDRLVQRRTDAYIGPESARKIYASVWEPEPPPTDSERGVVQHRTRGGRGCVARIRRTR